MQTPTLLRIIAVALLSITLLAPAAVAKSDVATSPGSGGSSVQESELPLYLQLVNYISQLLTAGEEIPKALLNKIEAFNRNGK